MNIIRYGVAVLLLSGVTAAQTRPAFEVASIRPAPPERNEVSVGVRITGTQIRVGSWPLKEYLVIKSMSRTPTENRGLRATA